MNPDIKYVNPTRDVFNSIYKSKDRWFFCDCRFGNFRLRSGLENLFLIRCHYDNNVTELQYEGIRIPYIDVTGKQRITIPDFKVNNKYIIEIKAFYNHHNPTVQAKMRGMVKYCKENNMKPRLMSSHEFDPFFNNLLPL